MSSTPDAADKPEATPPAPKKKVSAQRRIISWVFILILLVLVFFEWRAQSSQAKSFKGLNAALEDQGSVGEVPFETFQETILQGSPSEDVDKSGALLRLHHYRWNGIFKTYHLRLLVNNDEQVIICDTAAEGDKVAGIGRVSKERMDAFVQQQREMIQKQQAEQKKQPAEGDAEKKPAESETPSEN